jgi:hypothetical protein
MRGETPRAHLQWPPPPWLHLPKDP